MTQINSYLLFNGNCREAMNFYQECLGGELTLQTIGESPLSGRMTKKMKNCILHATLSKAGLIIMASDVVGEKGFVKGNSISLLLNCSSEEEIVAFYKKLSEGGTKDHPVKESFWGASFGDLTDKFGTNWVLYFKK